MIGHVVGHYRLVKKLGEGGMGAVYCAQDEALGRRVALKLLSSQLISDTHARRRFVREAKAMAALSHPGICTVYEAGETDGQLFIAMALLEGETLRRTLGEGSLSIAHSIDIAKQVASALAAAHGKGIVHRDIKPENIMVLPGGEVKVLDFGLAQLADATQLTRTGMVVGTVAYMSPEQVRGEPVDERTDVWSLGVVLYEMLTGAQPFRAAYESALKYQIAHESPLPLKSLRPEVPPEVERVVMRCMEKQASSRFARAADVLADLKRVKHAVASLESAPTELRPLRSPANVVPVQILGERYRIERLLGRGGMGEVWLAFDLKLGVEVALKFLLPELGADPERVALLRREVRSARNVASPHACRVYDLVEIEGREVVSMEYVDGATLQDVLTTRSPLELVEARRIATQMLTGLQDIHAAGLVHRDLKPSNVMITRSGRVVVMDFGLAKAVSESQPVSVAGTPAYMAPEQMRGETIDARTDLYAAGMMLAEMVAPEGVRDAAARRALWDGLRGVPPRPPACAWEETIRRAVAPNRLDRFASAAEMARALGDASLRVSVLEEASPYPGLTSFSGEQARFFFGREMDVEAMWRKLGRLPMVALIGPSGTGKSSFLRAGVLAARPDGWSVVITTPGTAPFTALGQGLLPEFAGQTDAMRDLFLLHDINRSIPVLHGWRRRSKDALLIVDQFEELFTLNPPETQARFAELLGRLSVEAGIHVLVSMRDDFFLQCHSHPPLRPLFTEPVPLGPLSPQDLRRAVVEPARLCGFVFEDDALVDEMMREVEGERGALPMVAFAAAKLWDLRDRERGVITRRSYEEIGRVAGALAQHAEATLERIGSEREGIVREIFRNLITAQNTRLVRERDELLSVFPDRAVAETVLNALIDARLLTSFEIDASRDGSVQRHRIEIVHESLLTNWPRLVRWQTQDTEGAQLRDQLRQAAQLWRERNESDDLLWTGTAYQEFALWRERYPGGLTEGEEAFARSMTARNARKRRRRRVAVASAFLVLVAVIGIVGASWRKESVARRGAEASKLLALGRAALDEEPAEAVAYTIASLELNDSPDARGFAVEALSRNPFAVGAWLPGNVCCTVFVEFSPDGKRLVAGGGSGVFVFSRNDSFATVLSDEFASSVKVQRPQFTPDGDHVVFNSNRDPSTVRVWSLAEGRVVRSFSMEGPTLPLVRGDRLFLITDLASAGEGIGTIVYPAVATERTGKWTRARVRTWAFDDTEPRIMGVWEPGGVTDLDIDRNARWIAYPKGNGVYALPLDQLESGRARAVGQHPGGAGRLRFDPAGTRLASSDASTGEIRIWPMDGDARGPLRVIAGKDPLCGIWFSPSGKWIAAAYATPDKDVRVWDLTGPVDADPLVLHRRETSLFPAVAFDPSEEWVVVAHHTELAFWPLVHHPPYVLHGTGGFGARVIEFSPDGESIAAAFYESGIWIWSLTGKSTRRLWDPESGLECLAYDPRGNFIAAGTRDDGVYVVSLADGSARRLPRPEGEMWTGLVSVSPDGRWVAANTNEGGGTGQSIRVWTLPSGESRVLAGSRGCEMTVFSDDGRLWSGSIITGEVRAWNLITGGSELIVQEAPGIFWLDVSPDGRKLFVLSVADTSNLMESPTDLTSFDLERHTSRLIVSHGRELWGVHWNPVSRLLVSSPGPGGSVMVSPDDGGEPHILGQTGGMGVLSPDGRWVAAASNLIPVVHVWRTPTGDPIQTLPRDLLLERLRSLTARRAVPESASASGYRIEPATYKGWGPAPTW